MSFRYFGVYLGVSWAWNCYSWTSQAADASPGSDRSSALLCWQCGAGCYLPAGAGFWHCWPSPWPLVAQAQAKFQHQDQTSVNQTDCFNVAHFKTELKELGQRCQSVNKMWPQTPNIMRSSSKDQWISKSTVNALLFFHLESCSSLSLFHAVSSHIWFEFSLSTSLSRAFGLQVTQVTRTPSRQPRLELQISVRVK